MRQDPCCGGDELEASVRDWMAAWAHEVACVDLAAGRRRFAADVVAFGTRADVVRGLDALHDDQWRAVWPTIEDFRFDLDDLVVLASPDGQQAVAVCGWRSTGVAEDGVRFDRPGRATVVLRRTGDTWVGTHTHFSMAAGVPARSHARRRPTPS